MRLTFDECQPARLARSRPVSPASRRSSRSLLPRTSRAWWTVLGKAACLAWLVVRMRDGAQPQSVPHADALAQQSRIGADPRSQGPPVVVELANRDKRIVEHPPITAFEGKDDSGRDQSAWEPADILPCGKVLRCAVILEMNVFRDRLRDDPDSAHGPAKLGNPLYSLQPGSV